MCAGTSLVVFRDVKVPVENLLGVENDGFKLIMCLAMPAPLRAPCAPPCAPPAHSWLTGRPCASVRVSPSIRSYGAGYR